MSLFSSNYKYVVYSQLLYTYVFAIVFPRLATKATYKLEKVLMNNDVKKLNPVYQTSALEGFHSVILRFAPKTWPSHT